jgi:hypothetical protein
MTRMTGLTATLFLTFRLDRYRWLPESILRGRLGRVLRVLCQLFFNSAQATFQFLIFRHQIHHQLLNAHWCDGPIHWVNCNSFDLRGVNHHPQSSLKSYPVTLILRYPLEGLHHYRHSKIIFDELAHNPDFFIEALQYLFRAEHESDDDTVESADSTDTAGRSAAELAWDLLEKWRQMPGVSEDGSVDADALRTWVVRVRELACGCDRREIADIYIGHALAFSPSDPDGAWPHKSVRDLIEDLASSTIENGLCTQVFNNRGVTMRSPTDGGVQELKLVEQYEGYVIQIRDQWPRTAALLRIMADGYRDQARSEDVNAELIQDF